MNAIDQTMASARYARSVETSKHVRWDVDEDVIRGRRFDTAHKFFPDGLSLAESFTTLSDAMLGDVLPDGYRFDVDPNAVEWDIERRQTTLARNGEHHEHSGKISRNGICGSRVQFGFAAAVRPGARTAADASWASFRRGRASACR